MTNDLTPDQARRVAEATGLTNPNGEALTTGLQASVMHEQARVLDIAVERMIEHARQQQAADARTEAARQTVDLGLRIGMELRRESSNA